MKRIFLILFLVISAWSGLFAVDNGIPAAFVDIGLARTAGMGGAYAAVADDAGAVFYNPAGIATAEYADVAFMYTKQKWMVPYNYFGFIYPFNGVRGAGFGMIISGDELMDEKTFFLSYSENLDWILKVIKGIYIGTTMKMHFAGFGPKSGNPEDGISGGAWGLGMDFGLIYKYNENLQAGVFIRDGFSWINWTADYRDGVNMEGVPLTSDIGVKYSYDIFTVAADLKNLSKLEFGGEVTAFDYVDIRAGMSQTLDFDSYKEFSLGLGVGHFKFGANDELSMNFDFAFIFERLDSSMKIQTSFKFK